MSIEPERSRIISNTRCIHSHKSGKHNSNKHIRYKATPQSSNKTLIIPSRHINKFYKSTKRMKITSTLIVALAISGITEARLLGKKKSKKGGGSSDIVVDNRVGAIKTGGGGSNKAGGGGGGSKFRDPKLAPGIPPGTVWPGDESTNVDNRVPGQSTDGDCCNGEAGPQPPSGQDSAGNRVGGCAVPESGFKPTFSIAKKAEGFTLNNYITGVPRDFECECNDQCAVQDGTSRICCFKSHYFIGQDNKNIKLCVDLTGITEAAMSGCIVTPEEEPVLVGDVLDVALPVLSRPGVEVDPNK